MGSPYEMYAVILYTSPILGLFNKTSRVEVRAVGVIFCCCVNTTLKFVGIFQVDAEILGGMVVTIGDKYVDMSTASKIKMYTNVIQEAI